jgi:hypothetical protein
MLSSTIYNIFCNINPRIIWKSDTDEVSNNVDIEENLRNFLFLDNNATVSLYA